MRRAEELVNAMGRQGLEAAWIVSPENIRYLTGFAGEGSLFLSGDARVILTDFRYVEQAGREAPGCPVVRTSADWTVWQALGALFEERALKAVAIERGLVTLEQFDRLPRGVEYRPLGGLPEKFRSVKDEGEIALIRRASGIACAAFDQMLGVIRAGMTEKEVAVELNYRMLRLGSEGEAFPTIACAGANGALPHAVPSDHALEAGELLTLDFGAQVGGYKTDMTRTVAIGRVSDALRALYDAVLEAQNLALSRIRPGAMCRDVDAAARDHLEARYPGAFGHKLGHSVGLLIHEAPQLSATSEDVLTEGHVITVEPGVYLSGLGGCRIEDIVVLTRDGYENLITAPKQLIIL
jgi:Xaa-Pro aminopeptidase